MCSDDTIPINDSDIDNKTATLMHLINSSIHIITFIRVMRVGAVIEWYDNGMLLNARASLICQVISM